MADFISRRSLLCCVTEPPNDVRRTGYNSVCIDSSPDPTKLYPTRNERGPNSTDYVYLLPILNGATKDAKVVQNDMSGNCSAAPLRTAALNSGALPIMNNPTVRKTSHHRSKKMATRRKEGKRTDQTKQT
jgi:hypothetical protein